MNQPSSSDAPSASDAVSPPSESDASAAPASPPENAPKVSLERGVGILKNAVKTLPADPGVYRMVAADEEVLYVGKARNLARRVTNYTQPARLSNRLRRMVAETLSLEIVTTHTEVEALLLEINLIKRHRPRFNVLLRDDKTFPHILFTGDHPCPQLTKHRGAQSRKGDYFGPFASAGAVNRTITALQKAFLLRNCSDAIYRARTRPCLQYQIKRCTAPCVGLVEEAEYRRQADQARDFLRGRSDQVKAALVAEMEAASEALDFESAALLRDRVRALAQIQAHQDINIEGVDEADVIAAHAEAGQVSIQVFFFRGGQNFGNRAYFPSHDKDLSVADVLAGFIGQFYENREPPRLLLLSDLPAEAELIAEALSLKADRKVRLLVPKRGPKRNPVAHALVNARDALGRRLAERTAQATLLRGVGELFGLEEPPRRIEVYDNSHIQGRNAVAAMIVAGPEGFLKGQYRKFTIRGEAAGEAVESVPTGGDDFAMMREVMTRRFGRALKEHPDRAEGTWPDLVLVDGGLGQLNVARAALAELGIHDVNLVGIAKGPDRDAGRERFFLEGREPFQLEPRDPVLYFLQRLRDEAHRFAIETHRAKRAQAIQRSELDDIPGIGARRKKALLHHFGSARAVARAGLSDLEAVAGINATVAKRVYDHFR